MNELNANCNGGGLPVWDKQTNDTLMWKLHVTALAYQNLAEMTTAQHSTNPTTTGHEYRDNILGTASCLYRQCGRCKSRYLCFAACACMACRYVTHFCRCAKYILYVVVQNRDTTPAPPMRPFPFHWPVLLLRGPPSVQTTRRSAGTLPNFRQAKNAVSGPAPRYQIPLGPFVSTRIPPRAAPSRPPAQFSASANAPPASAYLTMVALLLLGVYYHKMCLLRALVLSISAGQFF